jgi:hypothetical protein
MKIKSAIKIISVEYHIETDEMDYPNYIRTEGGAWRRWMGESTESVYIGVNELEEAFQEYINEKETN